MSDVTSRVITKYLADTSDQRREIDALIKKNQQLQEAEKQAAEAREGHFDQLVLDLSRSTRQVEDGAMSWDGYSAKSQGFFARFGSGLTSAVRGVNDMVGKLSPYNQALELAGKAANFAGDALDAYAKKSPAAAREVAALRKEFGGLKDSAMALAGEGLLRLVEPLAMVEVALKKARGEAVTFEEAVMKAFKHFDSEGARARRGIGGLLSGDLFRSAFGDTWSDSNADDLLGEGLGKLEDANKKRLEAAKKAYEEAQIARAEAAARASMRAGFVAGDPNNVDGRTRRQDWWMLGVAADTAQYDKDGVKIDEGRLARQASEDRIFEAEQAARDERDRVLGLANMREADNMSYLETAFGSLETLDAYRQGFETLGQAFGAFSEAVGAGYEAIVTGQSGIAEAFKKTLATGLLSIGKSSVVEALRQTALGFGALAFGSPTAAMHFKSAAMHGAVAVAAGLAANAMGAGGSAPAASGGGASAGGSAIGNAAGIRGDRGSGERPIYNFIVGEHFSNASNRQRAIMAQETIDKALRDRDE
jgi:hypothetical protein